MIYLFIAYYNYNIINQFFIAINKKLKNNYININSIYLIKIILMEHSIPWIEKYRPHGLEDLMLDPQIATQINVFIENTTNTHLIITGSPGIGKTSTAKCIAKKMLGDNIKDGYLELNAAENRGVKDISIIIPPFCKKVVDFTEPKIILLDEADNLTAKCQYDINTMIKQFGHKTKFIFTCNSSSEIIEDIQSVCRIIQFKKLIDEQISNYLKKICKIEDIKYNKTGLDTICYISAGDMRMAINNLQLVAFTYGNINKQYVLKICKLPDPDEVLKIINFCLAEDLSNAHIILDSTIKEGYHYLDIVTCFGYVLTFNFDADEKVRIQLMDIVQKTKIAISLGVRTKLQLSAMICRLAGTVVK